MYGVHKAQGYRFIAFVQGVQWCAGCAGKNFTYAPRESDIEAEKDVDEQLLHLLPQEHSQRHSGDYYQVCNYALFAFRPLPSCSFSAP